jgi:hypothetical protein
VVVGAVVAVLAWCVASPWTFAVAVVLAATAWVHRLAGSTGAGRLRPRLVAAHVVDDREWQLLRLLPVLSLAVVGWAALLGASGMTLVLVDAAFGVPLLSGRHDRWPDGRDVGHIPDSVEGLAPTAVVEVVEGRAVGPPPQPAAPRGGPPPGRASWPGPRTLLPDLDDDELLHAWEASARALRLRPGPTALLRIVTARARYLDALAERDPDGLARRLGMDDRDDSTPFDSSA